MILSCLVGVTGGVLLLITLLLAFLGLRRVALATDSALCLVHPNVGSALIRLGGVCSRGVPRLAMVGDIALCLVLTDVGSARSTRFVKLGVGRG